MISDISGMFKSYILKICVGLFMVFIGITQILKIDSPINSSFWIAIVILSTMLIYGFWLFNNGCKDMLKKEYLIEKKIKAETEKVEEETIHFIIKNALLKIEFKEKCKKSRMMKK